MKTIKGQAADNGIAVTERSTHLRGQLVAVHPAYDLAFDGFAGSGADGAMNRRMLGLR